MLETAELLRLTQSTAEAARAAVDERKERGEIADLGGGGWLVRARASEAASAVRGALARYHAEHRYAIGMDPAHVCGLLGLGERSFAGLAQELAAVESEITAKRGRLALASFKPALSARQMKLRDEIARRLDETGVKGIARGNLTSELGASEQDMKLLTRLMGEDGTMKVLGRHLMSAAAFEECRRKLLALFEQTPNVELSAFREATGAPRNQAVTVLEQFDVEGLTRRADKGRVLVKRRAEG